MKKKFLLVIPFIIFVYFFNKYYGFNNNSIMPNFKYENINGLLVEKKHFNPLKKTLIIYFTTSCSSCKDEILDDSIVRLKDRYNLIYITSEKDVNKVKNFINYDFLKKSDISLLFDKNNDFASDFKIGLYYQYPLIISYDIKGRNRTFVKHIAEL